MVHDLETGEERELYADRRSKPSSFAWKPDSSGFYAIYPRGTADGEDWGAINVVHDVSVPDLTIEELDVDNPFGVRRPFVAVSDGFITGLCNGARPAMARYFPRTGGGLQRIDLDGAHAGRYLSIAKAKDADRIVYITGSASDPDHVYTARLTGAAVVDEKEIHRPNKGFEQHSIARTEITRWTGANGDEVEGILYYPHDFEGGGAPRPLVLITHGGPHARRSPIVSREAMGEQPEHVRATGRVRA